MNDHQIYKAPQSESPSAGEPSAKPRVGPVFLSATILFVCLNSVLAYYMGLFRSGDKAVAFGFVIGTVHIFPLVTIGILALFKSKRNSLSMTWAYFAWSVITLLSILARLPGMIE